MTSSSPQRDGCHSGNTRRAAMPVEATFISPRRARSLSERAAARGGLEQIVVHEEDFRRFGGDLQKLRQCQVPPWSEQAPPPRKLSQREEFEQRCRSHIDPRDPWLDLPNPERTRQVYESDITVNQVWVDRSPPPRETHKAESEECERLPSKCAQTDDGDHDPVEWERRRKLLDWVQKISLPAARLSSAGISDTESTSEAQAESLTRTSSRRPSQQSRETSRRTPRALKPPRPDPSYGRLPSSADCSTVASTVSSTPRVPSPPSGAASVAGEGSHRSLRSSSREVKGSRTERPPRAPVPAAPTVPPGATRAVATDDAALASSARERGAPRRGAMDRAESFGSRTPRGPLPPLRKGDEGSRSSSRSASSARMSSEKDNAVSARRRSSSAGAPRQSPSTSAIVAKSHDGPQARIDNQLSRLRAELEELSLPSSHRNRRRHY